MEPREVVGLRIPADGDGVEVLAANLPEPRALAGGGEALDEFIDALTAEDEAARLSTLE